MNLPIACRVWEKKRFIMDLFFIQKIVFHSTCQHGHMGGKCFLNKILHSKLMLCWECHIHLSWMAEFAALTASSRLTREVISSCSVKIIFKNTVYFFVNTVNTSSLVVLLIQNCKSYNRIAYLKIYFKLHLQLLDRSDFSTSYKIYFPNMLRVWNACFVVWFRLCNCFSHSVTWALDGKLFYKMMLVMWVTVGHWWFGG